MNLIDHINVLLWPDYQGNKVSNLPQMFQGNLTVLGPVYMSSISWVPRHHGTHTLFSDYKHQSSVISLGFSQTVAGWAVKKMNNSDG